MHNAVLMCSYVRICDEGDEALQPEWEIDPKDLQIMEKVISLCCSSDVLVPYCNAASHRKHGIEQG